ncbi:MAG TPA: sulfotransferase, partial [Burkholderiales bacterium]|nr:sulfotransferase [Burkholderiales bacterium]
MSRYHNFIIVGTQRTGSSALADALGTHPQIACGWEWTQHGWLANKIKRAERGLNGDFSWLDIKNRAHMALIIGEQTRWLGFRRLFRSSDKWLGNPQFSPPLWVDRFNGHLRWLRSRPDIHVIHIVRRDNLEWIKSKILSRENKAFVGRAYADDPVPVNIRAAVRRLASKDCVDRKLMRLADGNPYLRVEYEDFVSDEQSTLNRIFAFLNCDLN